MSLPPTTPTPTPTPNPAPPREGGYHAANNNRMNAIMILFAAASPLSSLIRLTFLLMEYWNGYDVVYYSYDGAANSQHLNGDISASSMGSCSSSINPLLDDPNSFLGNDEGTGVSVAGAGMDMDMASEGSNDGASLADRIMAGNVTAEEVIHAILSTDPTATMSMSMRNRWNLNYPIATTYEYVNVDGNIVSTSTTVWQGDLVSILPWLICLLAVVIVPLVCAVVSLMHARGNFQFLPYGYGVEGINMNLRFGMYPGELAQRNALERSNRLKRKRRAKILMACLDPFTMKLTKRNIQYQDMSMASSSNENIKAWNYNDPTRPNESEGETEGTETPTTNEVYSPDINYHSEESNQNQDEDTLLVGNYEKEMQVWIPRAGMSTSHYEMYHDSHSDNDSSNKDMNISNNSEPLDPLQPRGLTCADFRQDSGNVNEIENIISPPNNSNSTISPGTDSKAGIDLGRANPCITNIKDTTSTSMSMPITGTCAICLSNYAVGESIVWSSNPSCLHAFHTNCMKTWIRKKSLAECPCCRQGFVKRSLYLAMKEERKRMESEEKIGASANVSANMNMNGGTSGNERSPGMLREEDLIIEG
uniref:RING-type domain-containing protein n=1 Tax=Chaetoceros debilis TaxID=122233 RepID=A0A7S3V848_9STRA